MRARGGAPLAALLLAAATAAAKGGAGETFIGIGDWGAEALGGYHPTAVDQVADAMAKSSESTPIAFVVNVGDNFYYCGIKNTSDFQVAADFSTPYSAASLDVPWYSILGNHE